MKNTFLSWHIFLCKTSLQSFGPCQSVMCMVRLAAEKEAKESTAI